MHKYFGSATDVERNIISWHSLTLPTFVKIRARFRMRKNERSDAEETLPDTVHGMEENLRHLHANGGSVDNDPNNRGPAEV